MKSLARQVGGNHYQVGMAIQPAEFILANDLGFAEGCVVKYVTRYRRKTGSSPLPNIEDLRKAAHYLEMLIERELKNMEVETEDERLQSQIDRAECD